MKKILVGVLGILTLAGGINLQDGIAQSITVSGYVRAPDESGIKGVVMNGLPGTPTPSTNDSGYYSGEIPPGWSGTVKPEKTGYAIHPPLNDYRNVTSSISENYLGAVLPKMALVLNKPTPTYYIGEDIWVTLTIQNQSRDIITTQDLMKKDFTLGLRFTDPDGNLITANLPTGAVLPTPPPPPVIVTPNADSITGDYVEVVLQGWAWSNTFNALNSYTLNRPGNYSVKAKFSMSDYPLKQETAPNSGVFYSPLDSGSSGDVESNVVSFALSGKADQTITFGELSNKSYGAPPFTVSATASSGLPVSFSILSGPATISGNTVTITGVGTVTVRASQAGNENYNPAPDVDRSFQVLYAFTGFFSPINNLPVFNRVKAGAAVPVKFSLNGNQGLNIFASGYPTSGTIACSPSGQVDVVEETVTAGSSSLSYDPALNQYTYVWKTNKAWSNTCRQLVIKFGDGSYQSASFQFTK